jgi:hypothetical protein
MLNKTVAQNFHDAERYAKSILSAVEEGRFLEKYGMSQEEYNYRELLGDWETPIEKLNYGCVQVKWKEARHRASFGHGYTK